MAFRNAFCLTALPADPFLPLFALDDDALAARCVQRRVSSGSGTLCRVGLSQVAAGGQVLLLAFDHHPAASPYRASGPIFVGRGAVQARLAPGEIPDAMRPGLFAAKAYDAQGDIIDADVAEGPALEPMIERLLGHAAADCLHLHYARRGCFVCRVERID